MPLPTHLTDENRITRISDGLLPKHFLNNAHKWLLLA